MSTPIAELKHRHSSLYTSKPARLVSLLRVVGPGLMVCLADSDIGGLFTMAVAGAKTGYALLLLQFALIPVLYVVQEMVVRLAVCRRTGLVLLTWEEMGRHAGRLLTVAMLILGISAMISEFSGVAAVGVLFGLTPLRSCIGASIFLCAVILPGDYRRVEIIGLSLGACLCVFLFTAVFCHPPWRQVGLAMIVPPTDVPANAKLGELVLANIGTVVTPWMLFYQASATVEKRLTVKDLPLARLDTLVGSVVTQLVMASVLLTFAVQARHLDVEKMAMGEVFLIPLKPLLGEHATFLFVGAGLLGSSLLASLVVSLGVAWNLTELFGGQVAQGATSTSYFRAFFVGTVLLGATVVATAEHLVQLNVAIQVLNGALMPVVVGCVFYLATSRGILPDEYRIKGPLAWFIALLLVVCAGGAWRLTFGMLIGDVSSEVA